MEDKSATLLARISKSREKLDYVAMHLKSHFVGLDDVIDRIISSIEAWYCMPELSTRPTIVCLWGLTGNGKTDLVRRLVKLLEMSDRFVEVQMTNKGSSQHSATTMQGLLCNSNLNSEEAGILLLDEIQRFRAVDGDGKDIADYQFQDLWMLLSDGSFGSAAHRKQAIIDMLCEAMYYQDYYSTTSVAKADDDDDDDDDDEDDEKAKKKKETVKQRKFKQNYWSAKQIKRTLGLQETVEDIMQWDDKKKLQMLTDMLDDKETYKAEVYSKLLIFVSGNLDEAYRMATATDETDIDADIFYKNSLNINLLNIKAALRSRFKPEQIARFGNTQIIYPALGRKSFESIIQRRVSEVVEGVKKTSDINVNVDSSVYDALYRNGVFPVQGTRPVFSTISSLFESVLPKFTMYCLKQSCKELSLSYVDKHIVATINGEKYMVKNEGEIDKIKANKRNENSLRKIAVHEAGHAIAYSLLFGVFPTQVVAGTASDNADGFIGIHSIDSNKVSLLDQITVLLAGRVAEEIVFGKSLASVGAGGDLAKATKLAAMSIRIWAFGETLSRIVPPSDASQGGAYNLDIDSSNAEIEKILKRQKEDSEKMLRDNLPLLKELSDYLINKDEIKFDDYAAIFKNHGKEVKFLDSKETIYRDLKDTYDDFWKKHDGEVVESRLLR
jgi:hypothetical protein